MFMLLCVHIICMKCMGDTSIVAPTTIDTLRASIVLPSTSGDDKGNGSADWNTTGQLAAPGTIRALPQGTLRDVRAHLPSWPPGATSLTPVSEVTHLNTARLDNLHGMLATLLSKECVWGTLNIAVHLEAWSKRAVTIHVRCAHRQLTKDQSEDEWRTYCTI